MDEIKKNTPKDLKDFFSTPEKPVALKEMNDFWQSLSEDDKEYYRYAELV